MRDKRWHQRAGERAEWFAVDAHATLFVQTDETVTILPVADRTIERHLLGVGDVVRDAASFVGGETGRQRDLAKQARIRRTVTHLYRLRQCFDDTATLRQAVVNGRKAVEQRGTSGHRACDTFGSFFVVVEAGVGVDGRGQQIAGRFKKLQQFDVLVDQRHASTRLTQRLALAFGLGQRAGKTFGFRHGQLIAHTLFKIHPLAGWPGLHDFFAFL